MTHRPSGTPDFSDPKTTASYDRRNDRARTKAINTMHMPWKGHV